MQSDPTVPAKKRRVSVVRVMAILAVLAIAPAVLVSKKHHDLVVSCSLEFKTPQQALSACDTLLTWVAWKPSTRSLMYRNKMRTHMIHQDWDAALHEVDLAIAEEPDNFVSWSWKAKVLQQAGDDAGMRQVSLEAFQRPPNTAKDLRRKYKQLFGLKLYDAVDEVAAQSVTLEEIVSGLHFDEAIKLVRNAGQYPKTHAAFVELALRLRNKVTSDLDDRETKREFLWSCRILGPACPALFPERRKSYPELSCEAAVSETEELYPNAKKFYREHYGYETALEYYSQQEHFGAVSVTSNYIGAVLGADVGDPIENPHEIIVTDRMFDCFAEGEFYNFQFDVDPEDKRMANEVLFTPELRRNLIDLAYATLNK